MFLEISIASTIIGMIAVIALIIYVGFGKRITADTSFIFYKLKMLVMIMVMGYGIRYIGQGDVTRNFEILPGVGFGDTGASDFLFLAIPFLSIFLGILSSVWQAVAIACLPLAHTVTDVDTGEVDESYSKYLIQIDELVYVYVFKIMNVFFIITLILYIWKSCYNYAFNRPNVSPKANIEFPVGFVGTEVAEASTNPSTSP